MWVVWVVHSILDLPTWDSLIESYWKEKTLQSEQSGADWAAILHNLDTSQHPHAHCVWEAELQHLIPSQCFEKGSSHVLVCTNNSGQRVVSSFKTCYFGDMFVSWFHSRCMYQHRPHLSVKGISACSNLLITFQGNVWNFEASQSESKVKNYCWN